MALLPGVALAGQTQPPPLPTGGQFKAGTGSLIGAANSLTVKQTSQRAIINFNQFSVGKGNTVSFQNGTGATLARVTGGSLTQILGNLQATGTLYLINPAGVVVSSSGVVVTNGTFVASTHNVADDTFMAGGTLLFKGDSTAAVTNNGSVSSTNGSVFLIARSVTNNGTITATQGMVGLAAGDAVLLQDTGEGEHVYVQASDDGHTGDATNTGAITAAQAALEANGGNVYALAVNGGGTIRATGTETREGHVWLTATGTASAPASVVANGTISAQNADGSGGTISVKAVGPVAAGQALASVQVGGTIDAGGTTGGTIIVTGPQVGLVTGAALTVDGAKGGGTILVGGDLHGGQGTTRFSAKAVTNAALVTIERGVTLSANALKSGSGGNVVVWSDQTTSFAGTITAQGAGTGSGGFAEVSGKGVLNFAGTVDLTAASGVVGTLLLDPTDVTITTNTTAGTYLYLSGVYSDTGASASNLNVADLLSELGTANLVVSTTSTGSGLGTIDVQTSIAYTGGSVRTLTLLAVSSITLESGVSITSNGAALNVVLNSNSNGNGSGSVQLLSGSKIQTDGGSIQLGNATAGAIGTSATSTSNRGVYIASATLDAGGGNISIIGTGASGGGNGIEINASTLQTSGAGTITLVGTGTGASGDGVLLANGTTITTGTAITTGTGSLSITGTRGGSSGYGIYGDTSTGTVTLGAASGESGTISLVADTMDLAASASNALLVDTTGIASVTTKTANVAINLGNTPGTTPGTLELPQAVVADFNVGTLQVGSGSAGTLTITSAITASHVGTLTLESQGAISEGAAATLAAADLSIMGGAVSLAPTGANAIGTLGSVTASSIALVDTGAVSIAGAVDAGTVSIRTTGGALTIATGGSVTGTSTGTGYNVVLASDTAFINQVGSGAVATGSGKFAIYSVNPTLDTQDGLSGTNVYGQSYTASPSYSVTGNVFLHTIVPTLTISSSGNTMVYGNAAPTLAAGYTGLIGGDAPTVATSGSPTLTTAVTSTTSVGTYSVSVGAGTVASLTGYVLTFVAGSVTVTPRPLTLSVANATRVYGAINPTFGYTVAGLMNGDLFLQAPSFTTTSGTASPVAIYAGDIAASGGSAGSNYTIASYVPGIMTVTAATLSVTADNFVRTYGALNPNFTATVVGATGSDTAALLVSELGLVAPAAPTNASVSTYAITTTSTNNGRLANYSVTFVPGVLTVTQAALTVVATAATRVYGDANPALQATFTGLVGGDQASDLIGSLSLSTTASTASPVGFYSIVAGNTALTNYTVNFTGAQLVVTARPLTLTAGSYSRNYGAADPSLTYSETGLVNGDSLLVEPVLALTSTLLSSSGVNTYSGAVLISGALANHNYAVTYQAGAVTILPASLQVTANSVTRDYGSSNGALGASFTGVTGGDTVASLTAALSLVASAGTASAVGGGYTITAGTTTGGALNNYNVTFTASALTVTRAPLTVMVNAVTQVYGTGAVTPTATITGTTGSDTSAGLLTALALSASSVTTGSTVGSYAITVGNTTTGVFTNYTVTLTNAFVTVSQRPITLTADDFTRTYGSSDPSYVFVATNFLGSDTLTGQPTLSVTTTTASSVGSYAGALHISGGTVGSNYTIASYVAGSISITQATLVVDVASVSRAFGIDNPSFGATLIGVTGADSAATLLTELALMSSATANSAVANYSITAGSVTAGQLSNYAITVNPGVLTVIGAQLTVSIDAKSRLYGAADPVFTASVQGVTGGDSVTTLVQDLALTAGANSATGVGTYVINSPSLSNGALANYNVTVMSANLTITPAPLSIVLSSASRFYGDTLVSYMAAMTGVVAADTTAGLLTDLALSTTAISSSPTGVYMISTGSLSNGQLANYIVNYTGNLLTVTPRPLTIIASDSSRIYGGTDPAYSFTVGNVASFDSATAALLASPALAAASTVSQGSAVGNYAINATGGIASANYTIVSYVAGTLSIIAAPLTVYIDSKNVITNTAIPSLTATFSGNYEPASELTTALNLATLASNGSPTGTYAITAGTTSGGLFSNYSVTVVPGYVYIIPPTLTATTTTGTSGAPTPTLIITVTDVSRYYGSANPGSFAATIAGVTGSDTTQSILAALNLSTMAVTGSNVGIYSIFSTANFASTSSVLSHYAVDFVSGSLSVTPVPVTATANSLSRVYGSVNFSGFGYTVTGLLPGQTLLNAPAFTVNNTTTSATSVGTVAGAISLTAGGGGNYTIVDYVAGNLVITPAPLTVQVTPQTRFYGAANPSLTALLVGVTGPDQASDLLADLGLSISTAVNAPVGVYPISYASTAAGGLSNYAVSIVGGDLTVKAAPLTLNIGSATTTYGAQTPSYSVALVGIAGGDSSTTLLSELGVTTNEGTASGVGVYFVAPTSITGTALSNYVLTVNSGQITVSARALTVTAGGDSHVYGAANPSLGFSTSGLVNGDGLSVQPTLTTTTTSNSAVGNYAGDVIAAGAYAGPNYVISYVAGATTITQATLTVTANSYTRFYGDANASFGASFSGITGADTSSSLTAALALVTGADTTTGIGAYAITSSGTLSNYVVMFSAGTLSITPRPLTVIASDASHVYGSAIPGLTYTTSGLVNGDRLTVLPTLSATEPFSANVGTYAGDIHASGASGTTNYAVVSYVFGTMTITPAPLLVTVGSTSRLFGATNPSFSASLGGVVNGDSSSTLITDLALASAAGTSSNVGSYAISATGLLANYSLTVVPGTLTVTQAPLVLTEIGQTLVYGGVVLPISSTLSGVTGGNTTSQLTALLALSTLAGDGSGVGTYAIENADPTTPGLSNYSISINTASIVITKASLTIDIDNKTRIFGATDPSFTAGFTGVAGNDTPDILLTDLSLSAGDISSSHVGDYTISSGTTGFGQLSNYSITLHTGTLSITPAVLTVAVNPASRQYGDANPSLSATVTGATGGDSDSSISGQLSLTALATTASAVGNYAIVSSNMTGSTLANYSIVFSGNSLSVTPAPLTIDGIGASRVYGASDLPFGANITGATAGDSTSTMITSLLLSAGDTSNTGIGTYTIAAGQTQSGIFSNYSVTFVPGLLTITPATLNVTGNSATRLYGAADPTFTATLVGVVGGDLPAALLASLSFNAGDTSSTGVSDLAISIGNRTSGVIGNYVVGTYTAGTLTILPAPLTIAAITTSRVYGSANPSFSAVFTGLTGGDTSSGLLSLVALSSAATTLSSIGSTYTIVAGATASLTNYSVTYIQAPLTITPAPLTILGTDATRAYYTAELTSYAATVNGVTANDTVSQVLAALALTPGTNMLSNVGSDAINGTTSGGVFGNYTVNFTPGHLFITKQPLTVLGDSTSRLYGATDPSYTASLDPFVGPDSVSNVLLALALKPSVTSASSVGSYQIAISGDTTSGILANYSVTLQAGYLTITRVPLTVTVGNYSTTYGTTASYNNVGLNGATGGDTSSTLVGDLSLTSYAASTNVGPTYAINAGSTNFDRLNNYNVTVVPGNLSIAQAPLLVSATNTTAAYGVQPTASLLSLSFVGITGGDNSGELSSEIMPTYAVGTGSTPTGYIYQPNIGSYTIALSGNTSSPGGLTNPRLSNYAVTLSPGTFLVTAVPLTIATTVGPSTTLTYNGHDSAGATYGVSYTGFVYEDNQTSALTGTLAYGGTGVTAINVGAYSIGALGLSNTSAQNYSITYVAAPLTIAQAPLTATVNPVSVAYNGSVAYGSSASFSYVLSGFVNNETSSVVTGTAAYSGPGATASNVSTYAVSLSNLSAQNYAINYVVGSLTITPIALAITVGAYNKHYGDADPVYTPTYVGLAAGDVNKTATLTSELALTAYTTSTPVGSHPITNGSSTAGLLSNYTITFTAGTLTIADAFLTVMVNSETLVYGQGLSYSATISGYTSADSSSALLADLALSYGIGTAASFPSIGLYTITPTAGSTLAGNLSNYAISFVTGNLSITPAPLTITVVSQSHVYAGTTYAYGVSYSPFAGNDTSSTLTGTLAYSGTGTTASTVGSYNVTASGLADSNYTISYAVGTLTITQAPLTVTAKNVTATYDGSAAYGGSASFGVTYSSGLVSGDQTNLGTILFDSNSRGAENAGTYTITPSGLSGSAASNYNISYMTGTLSIAPAPLTVTVNSQTVTYNGNTFGFSVSYSPFVGGDTIATALNGSPTYGGAGATAKTVGNYAVTLAGLTNKVGTNYLISLVTGSLSIVKAPLTVTANMFTVVYDGSAAYSHSTTFGVTYSGLISGDMATIGTIAYDSGSRAAENVGSYTITPSGLAGSAASNYNISYLTGLLSITPAPLTITVNSQTATYSGSTFGFSVSYSPLVGSDTVSSALSGTAVYSGTGTTATTIGSYSVLASGISANNANYAITYDPGTLSILQRALTVTANSLSVTYDGLIAYNNTAIFGVGYSSGLVAGDMGNLGTIAYDANSTTAKNAGLYTITPSGLAGSAASNYNISYLTGTLSIAPAPLTVTVASQTETYTGSSFGFSVSASGFVNNETTSVLTWSPAFGGTGPTATTIGNYSVTASGVSNAGGLNNYAISYVAGTLSIMPAALTVTANTLSVIYDGSAAYGGSAIFGVSYNGLVSSDAGTIGTPLFDSGSRTAENAGLYTITPSGLAGTAASNYTISYMTGLLSIAPAPLTITVNSQTQTYSGGTFGFSVSYSPLVGGDTVSSALAGTPAYSGTGTTATTIGSYSVLASGISANNSNYAITYDPGTLSITPKALTVTANSLSVTYDGQVAYNNTAIFGVGYTGLVAADSGTIGTIAYDANSTTAKNAGSYAITPSGLAGSAASNYNISYAAGLLSIAPAPLTITVNSQTETYSGSTFGFSVSYSSLVGGETVSSVLAGTPVFSGTGATATTIGNYSVAASGISNLANANYAISYVTGTLSITPAALTVTANTLSVIYDGSAAYGGSASFGVGYAGLVSSDAGTIGTPLFDSGSRTAENAGLYTITPSGLAGSAASNYTISYMTGLLSIAPAPLTVTVNSQTQTYTSGTFGFTVAYSPFAGSDTVSSALAGTPVYSGTGVGATNAGSYSVAASGLSNAVNPNYAITYAPGILSITQAPLTVTANSLSVVYDGSVAFGNSASFGVAYAGVLGSDQGSLGTIGFDPTSTAAKNAGSYTIAPSGLAGSAASNYAITYVSGVLSIAQAPLTVTANSLSVIYDGSVAYGGSATFGVGYAGVLGSDQGSLGTIGFDPTSTGAKNAGSYTITPSGLGGSAASNYAITYVSGGLSIGQAPLTVTANSLSVLYDGSVAFGGSATFGASYTGLLGSDTTASLGGTLGYDPSSTAAKNAGSYTISPSGLTAANYTISYAPGQLTIGQAPLTVTANSLSVVYDGSIAYGGSATFGVGYTGLLGSDTAAASLGGTLGYDPTSTAAKNAGSYAITPSGLTAANYAISYVSGALSIGQAPLTVTANSLSVAYNGFVANGTSATFSYGVSGLVGGETVAVVNGTAAYGGAATSALNVGSYGLTVGGLSAANYAISYAPGSLSIGAIPLTIVVNSYSRLYGGTDPSFAASLTGIAAGDTTSGLMSGLALSRDSGSSVGSYAITAGMTSGQLTNYIISMTPGQLVINPAPLTVDPGSATRFYGDVNPALSATLVGVTGGDSIDALLAAIALSTPATTTSNVGSYAISAAATASLSNYTLVLNTGELDVVPRPLVLTASNGSVVYGSATPSLGYTVSGLVNGDQIASAPTLSTDRVTTSNVGGYAIDIASGSAGSNYVLSSYVPGLLSVTPAALSVAIPSNSRLYGSDNPAFTALLAGITGADDFATLLADLQLGSAATSSSNVGSYAIAPASTSAGALANYTLSVQTGTLAINPATLTYVANQVSRTYGTGNTLDGDVAGFVLQQTLANATTGTLTFSSVAGASANVGTYSVAGSGLAANAGNYVFVQAATNATALTVTPATATVTAESLTRLFDTPNPTFVWDITGLVNGDAATVIDGIAATSTATQTSNPANYPITVAGGVAVNYDLVYIPGVLMVTPMVTAVVQEPTQNSTGVATGGLSTSLQQTSFPNAVASETQSGAFDDSGSSAAAGGDAPAGAALEVAQSFGKFDIVYRQPAELSKPHEDAVVAVITAPADASDGGAPTPMITSSYVEANAAPGAVNRIELSKTDADTRQQNDNGNSNAKAAGSSGQ